MLIENYKFISKKLKDLSVIVYKGKSHNSSDLIPYDGIDSINYVTRTEQNNGVKCRVLIDNFADIEPGNAITIGDTTATVFYQKEQFIVGEHIVILRADWINEYTGEFVAVQLQKESFRYPPFARAFIKDCILETKILVPVDENNEISFKFMEDYIKDLNINEENIINEIPDYFLNEGYKKACWYLDNIDKQAFEKEFSLQFSRNRSILNTANWKKFKLGDNKYFNIKRGSSEYIKNMYEGDYPYISTTMENNGIGAFVSKYNRDGNLITLAYDGSIGACFYQKNKFFASEKIVTIDIVPIKLNVYIAMFLIGVLKLEAQMYSYGGRKWTVEEQLKNTEIMLPVDNFGEPNWLVMEDYIKSLPFSINID